MIDLNGHHRRAGRFEHGDLRIEHRSHILGRHGKTRAVQPHHRHNLLPPKDFTPRRQINHNRRITHPPLRTQNTEPIHMRTGLLHRIHHRRRPHPLPDIHITLPRV